MRCHQCEGRFGLVRHYLLTFTGYLHFCSKKCVEAHKTERDDNVARLRFLTWLRS
jgi:hypothetical protein